MQAANQGVDPFHPSQQKGGPKTDQDLAAFGAAFNKVKVPVYTGVLVAMLAAQPILAKVSERLLSCLGASTALAVCGLGKHARLPHMHV